MENLRVVTYNNRFVGRSIAGTLLLVFVAYYVNVTLFVHSHVIDGVTIVHSHIYSSNHTNGNDNSDDNNDAHTESELTLISTLGNFLAEAQESFVKINVSWVEYHPIFTVSTERISASFSRELPLLRAPPVDNTLMLEVSYLC